MQQVLFSVCRYMWGNFTFPEASAAGGNFTSTEASAAGGNFTSTEANAAGAVFCLSLHMRKFHLHWGQCSRRKFHLHWGQCSRCCFLSVATCEEISPSLRPVQQEEISPPLRPVQQEEISPPLRPMQQVLFSVCRYIWGNFTSTEASAAGGNFTSTEANAAGAVFCLSLNGRKFHLPWGHHWGQCSRCCFLSVATYEEISPPLRPVQQEEISPPLRPMQQMLFSVCRYMWGNFTSAGARFLTVEEISPQPSSVGLQQVLVFCLSLYERNFRLSWGRYNRCSFSNSSLQWRKFHLSWAQYSRCSLSIPT